MIFASVGGGGLLSSFRAERRGGGRASQKTIFPKLCDGKIGLRYYDFVFLLLGEQKNEILGESHPRGQNLNSISAEGHFLACL